MIRKLHIQRFRSILDAELELGRVNLFIGGNGSGKSNVLEAIGVISSALGRGVDADTLAKRGVRLSRPHFFKSSFRGQRHAPSFHLKAEFNISGQSSSYDCVVFGGGKTAELAFQSEELVVGEQQLLRRTPRGGSVIHGGPSIDQRRLKGDRSLWDVASQIISTDEASLKALNMIAQYAIFSPQTSVMRGVARVDAPLIPLGLEGSGLARCMEQVYDDIGKLSARTSLAKELNKILGLMWLPGWTDQVEVGEPDPDVLPRSVMVGAGDVVLYLRDRFMREDRNYLSPYDASEGTLYLAFMAALMGHSQTPKVFAIDNVDGTLNPSLVRRLVDQIVTTTCSKTARKHSRLPQQVFLTSHHPTSLDAFDLFDPEQRVFVVYRDTKSHPAGATHFYRLQPPPGMTREQWIVTQRGLNLSELWIEGRIREALG